MPSPQIKRALISVSDKTGVADFAKSLSEKGIEIYSTGGTRRHLEEAGIQVIDVATYTGFPEMMDGRVKTLHPKIFAGILCRHDMDSDLKSLSDHDIKTFELVVVNLYPFAETIAKPGIQQSEAIEQIDIGGPSLVRAAAKNSAFTSIVSSPDQYEKVQAEIETNGCTSDQTRNQLMAAAFAHTADYDATIAGYFQSQADSGSEETFAPAVNLRLQKKCGLRYGENSHQSAALYRFQNCDEANLIDAEQLNGKELSYNNLLDLDSALSIVRGQSAPACSVIKHNNPCGAAADDTLIGAVRKGFAGDPVSAFGSVIGLNREIDEETAQFLAEGDFFVEAIVAPQFSKEAIEILTTKPKWKKNVRLLQVGELGEAKARHEYRFLVGGMLAQEADNLPDDSASWTIPTKSQPDDAMLEELKFGWSMVRFVKSNAISLSHDRALVGVGAGQMSRVDSVQIAIRKAGERSKGSILSSDAFFPFADSIALAADAGIAAIIQPGGSVRDQDVIDACDEHRIPMVFAGNRHFRH